MEPRPPASLCNALKHHDGRSVTRPRRDFVQGRRTTRFDTLIIGKIERAPMVRASRESSATL